MGQLWNSVGEFVKLKAPFTGWNLQSPKSLHAKPVGICLYVSLHSICLAVSGNTQPPQPATGVLQGFLMQKAWNKLFTPCLSLIC